MKKTAYFIAILIAAMAIIMVATRVAGAEPTANIVVISTPATATSTPIVVKDILTHRQRSWIGALEWCESKDTPTAVNPKDRDNTPSYGRLQFKPGTFNYFMARYSLGTSTNYMDADLQERIVEQMIIRGDVNWHQQFPDCVRKLGLPPQLSPSVKN